MLWEDQPASATFVGGPPRLWDDIIYWTGTDGNGDELLARDIRSGDILWRTPAVVTFPITVTAAGIVAALPVENDEMGIPESFTLALLDRQSGAILWQTDRMYRHSGELGFNVVDEQSVMFVDDSMTVVAIDLVDGSERWRYDATRGRTEAEMLGACTPLSGNCGNRAYQWTLTAFWGDTLYIYLPIPAEVIALSALDGSLRWAGIAPEQTGQQSPDMYLLATELGVVVIADDTRTAGVIAGQPYLGLRARNDGGEVWVRAEPARPIIRAGEMLIMPGTSSTAESGSSCCTLLVLDLATGAVISEQTFQRNVWPVMYFSASDVLLLSDFIIRDPLSAESASLAPLPVPECGVLWPASDGSHLVCQRADFTLAVYEVRE